MASRSQPTRSVAGVFWEILGQRRLASVLVSGGVSVSDQRSAGCVGDQRVREARDFALRFPQIAHELAHALAHATRGPRAGPSGETRNSSTSRG